MTDPADADADFEFVGEYLGAVSVFGRGVWTVTPIGLQVVAVGDGRFEAVEYLGGLPGGGWDGREKVVLPGRREGRIVRIDARPTGITLDGVTGRVGHGGHRAASGVLRRINRSSPTLGMRPPREATVLFGSGGTDRFVAAAVTGDGLLAEGAETKEAWSDFTLHLEFRLPYMPAATGQGRANSGVYLQRRYEVQILDSFGRDAVVDGAASLYRTKAADLNMSFPPLSWQTYDIRFRPAAFEDGRKTANARLTIWHNGVKVHDGCEVPNKTGAGRPEGPDPLPILLQDHGDPVRFRNVWIVDHSVYPGVDAVPKIMRTASRPSPPTRTAVTESCPHAVLHASY